MEEIEYNHTMIHKLLITDPEAKWALPAIDAARRSMEQRDVVITHNNDGVELDEPYTVKDSVESRLGRMIDWKIKMQILTNHPDRERLLKPIEFERVESLFEVEKLVKIRSNVFTEAVFVLMDLEREIVKATSGISVSVNQDSPYHSTGKQGTLDSNIKRGLFIRFLFETGIIQGKPGTLSKELVLLFGGNVDTIGQYVSNPAKDRNYESFRKSAKDVSGILREMADKIDQFSEKVSQPRNKK